MKAVHIIFITLTALCSMSSMLSAQDLEKHLWNHRVIILYTPDSTLSHYQNQLTEFRKVDHDLGERKIALYQVIDQSYMYTDFKKNTSQRSPWLPLDQKNLKIKDRSTTSLTLIGLDGGIKLQTQRLVKRKELFDIIDSMPMRRAELNR